MGKRELVALLNLSSYCLVMVKRLFLAVPWCCLRFVIVVFPGHIHDYFLFIIPLSSNQYAKWRRDFVEHHFSQPRSFSENTHNS